MFMDIGIVTDAGGGIRVGTAVRGVFPMRDMHAVQQSD
jgi:hypothetical protein